MRSDGELDGTTDGNIKFISMAYFNSIVYRSSVSR